MIPVGKNGQHSTAATSPNSLTDWIDQRGNRARWVMIALVLATFISVIIGLGSGPVQISPSRVLQGLLHALGLFDTEPLSMAEQATVIQLRLPRIVLALLVGAVLAQSGAVMQGFLRNPLADPGLLGVSSGAALAAAVVIVLGPKLTALHFIPMSWLLPISAFLGGLFATAIVLGWAVRERQLSMMAVLLAGIALNALSLAGIGYLTQIADDPSARTLNFWTFGSLGKAGWEEIAVAAPWMLLPVLWLPRAAAALNALLLGEAEARHMGFDVTRIKWGLLIAVAFAVGAAVALSGLIAFIGLLTPHLLRLVLGPDHRLLLPASALLGGVLLVNSDTLARIVMPPSELSVGILTTALGAPFFLWLLRTRMPGAG